MKERGKRKKDGKRMTPYYIYKQKVLKKGKGKIEREEEKKGKEEKRGKEKKKRKGEVIKKTRKILLRKKKKENG